MYLWVFKLLSYVCMYATGSLKSPSGVSKVSIYLSSGGAKAWSSVSALNCRIFILRRQNWLIPGGKTQSNKTRYYMEGWWKPKQMLRCCATNGCVNRIHWMFVRPMPVSKLGMKTSGTTKCVFCRLCSRAARFEWRATRLQMSFKIHPWLKWKNRSLHRVVASTRPRCRRGKCVFSFREEKHARLSISWYPELTVRDFQQPASHRHSNKPQPQTIDW